MIRPFFEKLTVSEIHAVCTGGFATIAGSVMAAYIIYGVNIFFSLSDLFLSCFVFYNNILKNKNSNSPN